MNLRRWLHEHSLKLLAIRDTPNAIAGGVAIGIFFGFMPLFGLKTLLAIFFAWLTRSNILAAVIAGALHDVILPFMPFIYRWEYDLGYWLLSNPHQWPEPLRRMHLSTPHAWRNWTTYLGAGKHLVVGGAICSTPFSVVSFFIAREIVARHHRKRDAAEKVKREEQEPP
ncbi:MAG TPA: DUF2062 domain-containing protein [Candidatus Dormibacteraeota bacterium]|nr:DUF2062 domain-containing protein [Candidatus Dormibacteraeota bacterium]